MTRKIYALRIGAVFVVFLVCFYLLGKHYHRLQVVRHHELADKARNTYTAQRLASGSRGEIRDVQGNLIVGNVTCKDIRALPHRVKPAQRGLFVKTLHEHLGVDPTLIRKRLESGLREVVIKNEVDLEIALELAELKLPGLRFVDAERREYPKERMLANIVGFTQRQVLDGRQANVGVNGLERIFDDQLSPRSGVVTYKRDRKGRALHRGTPERPQVLDGANVYLTIHEPIQHIVESELEALQETFAPRYAYALMADPKTGAILAVAQNPSFHPGDRVPEERPHWVSHFVTNVYDPGSAIKGLVIAGALDYGVTTLDDQYYCEKGYWFYGGRMLRDAGHHYEMLSVAEIIQKSSNIGTAKIAIDMGEMRLYQLLRRWGFGEQTNIGLPAESAGILRKPKDWDTLSITRFPIGQGISVTPLQMVQAYCTLANKGDMMQLYLVDRIENPVNGDVTRTAPKYKHTVVRSRAARQATEALKMVTAEGGTATRAAVPGYAVAGKTGTAQKLVDGTYNSGKHIASFIGFVPADDPAFVLLVVADEPSKGSYYGGTVCGPSFRRISEQTLRYLNIEPTYPEELVSGLP